jgi:cytochrome c oxidase subunit 2
MMGQSGVGGLGGQQENAPESQMGPGEQTGGGQATQSDSVSPDNGDAANGERIYFTATNESGQRFTYTGGPDFGGMMMGSYLTCASCHGPEARGGQHIMHMQTMDAPPIYGEALSGHDDEHDEGQTDSDAGHEEQGTYTLEDFRMAVVKGQHPDGEPLDQDMPRWNIDDQDLADLLAFLKSLPGE